MFARSARQRWSSACQSITAASAHDAISASTAIARQVARIVRIPFTVIPPRRAGSGSRNGSRALHDGLRPRQLDVGAGPFRSREVGSADKGEKPSSGSPSCGGPNKAEPTQT